MSGHSAPIQAGVDPEAESRGARRLGPAGAPLRLRSRSRASGRRDARVSSNSSVSAILTQTLARPEKQLLPAGWWPML